MANTILKKARSKTEVNTETDKLERDQAQWLFTHGGQIADWSKKLFAPLDCLKSSDKGEPFGLHKKRLQGEDSPFRLTTLSKTLKYSPDAKYPEVHLVSRKAQSVKCLWKYS